MLSSRIFFVVLCLTTAACCAGRQLQSGTGVKLSSRGRPLVERPAGTQYKTVLYLDAGGTRGIIAVMVLLELEQAIKRYLLAHPQLLPAGFSIARLEDFDINLADYFDCIAGDSAGGWSALYLASRGGQGASRAVLDSPEIVEKYGITHGGGVEGLRIFFTEFISTIYPFDTIDTNAGRPLDITNPMAPGVSEPLYSPDGADQTLSAFLGNTTLADCDTSLIVATLDIVTADTILFVQNAFREPSVTSSARLRDPIEPRVLVDSDTPLEPDLEFNEERNYFLADIGNAGSAAVGILPAKNVTPVAGNEIEFILIDAAGVVGTGLVASYFTASESGMTNLDFVAILHLGTGSSIPDRSAVQNAGFAGWTFNADFISIIFSGVQRALNSITDYIFFSNPAARPLQYLRIQASFPPDTEEGFALLNTFFPAFFDAQQEIGVQLAEENIPRIETFVSEFIFK